MTRPKATRQTPEAEALILSDTDIRAALDAGHIALDPFDDDLVQPASVDIRVDARFRIFSNHLYTCIDPRERQDDLTSLNGVPGFAG